MTNSATISHYDEISALIFNGTTQTGSGCLLWADDKSTLYCVTAKHCTCCMESGNEYDVKIKTKVNGEIKELIIDSNKVCSASDDIAIYIIKIDEYTKNIPCTQTSNLLKNQMKFISMAIRYAPIMYEVQFQQSSFQMTMRPFI